MTGARPSAGLAVLLAVSLGFSLLLLALVEAGLRLADVGEASSGSRLSWQRLYLPILEPGRRADGTAVWRTRDARLAFQELRQAPPADGLRIVAFGGSATAGLGYSPNVTFARYLERMLRRARPERPVEVLNLGMVSLASRQVAVLAEEVCRSYAPDLLLVYSGNNEFLEVHARKYFDSQATLPARLRERLTSTNLYRVMNTLVRGGSGSGARGEPQFSREDMQLEKRGVVARLALSEAERVEVIEGYQSNLERIVEVARDAEVPVVLMTVASNWRWLGRQDLPEGWVADLLELGDAAPTREDRLRALARLGEDLEAADPSQRHELLFRRAVLQERLGDLEAARSAYRAALDADPHLRRSLDEMAERVREVASQPGAILFDSIAWLSGRAENGILGFDEFYDHVHPTPRGALLLAQGLFGALRGRDPTLRAAAAAAFVDEELARIAALREDALALDAWLGIGFEPGRLSDRNLWKYEEMLEGLDERIERDPRDGRALAYRGNAHYFRTRGARQAEADYRASLAAAERAEVRANLERLLAEGRS